MLTQVSTNKVLLNQPKKIICHILLTIRHQKHPHLVGKIWSIPLFTKPKKKQIYSTIRPWKRFFIKLRSRNTQNHFLGIEWNPFILSQTPIFQDVKQTSHSTRLTLNNVWKLQLTLIPTWTIEQNKLLSKPFNFTDIKCNVKIKPFFTRCIP